MTVLGWTNMYINLHLFEICIIAERIKYPIQIKVQPSVFILLRENLNGYERIPTYNKKQEIISFIGVKS